MSLGLNLMINDFNENISDFVTELVVWSQQPLLSLKILSRHYFNFSINDELSYVSIWKC